MCIDELLMHLVQPDVRSSTLPMNFHQRNDVVVRVCGSQSVDLEFICLGESYKKLQMVFTASLLGAQYRSHSVENKPACVLVQNTLRDASILIWQTGVGAKQSTRRDGPV